VDFTIVINLRWPKEPEEQDEGREESGQGGEGRARDRLLVVALLASI